ncbi:hypothetical protein PCH70_04970 [Pseudomonas cichorii JBC1]|nr:hypothetical protein PCH70_04970 [Pseudomonas cichorii JBC1]
MIVNGYKYRCKALLYHAWSSFPQCVTHKPEVAPKVCWRFCG